MLEITSVVLYGGSGCGDRDCKEVLVYTDICINRNSSNCTLNIVEFIVCESYLIKLIKKKFCSVEFLPFSISSTATHKWDYNDYSIHLPLIPTFNKVPSANKA